MLVPSHFSGQNKMLNKKKLFIECGLESLVYFGSTEHHCLLDQISRAKTEADVHNIHLEILIYSGIVSPLSGGRVMNNSLSEIEKIIEYLNSNGVSFNLALNGGLRYDLNLEMGIFASLDPVLNMLVRSSQVHGIRNMVTITHPALFDYIKQNFFELDTIASCIQALYPYSQHDYGESFEKYDYVVPLNQHTTPKFLEQYKNHSNKMILFFTLGCGTSNLEKCYLHYCEIESEYALSNEKTTLVNPDLLNPMPSQLPKKCYNCESGDLLSREQDLIGMISMGANKFKIPRNGILKRGNFLKLAYLFNEYY
jgi:hypothetical protein